MFEFLNLVEIFLHAGYMLFVDHHGFNCIKFIFFGVYADPHKSISPFSYLVSHYIFWLKNVDIMMRVVNQLIGNSGFTVTCFTDPGRCVKLFWLQFLFGHGDIFAKKGDTGKLAFYLVYFLSAIANSLWHVLDLSNNKLSTIYKFNCW